MQKRQFDVNFKIICHEVRIIFVHMIRIPAFTLGAFIVFFLSFMMALGGWNMEITWFIHKHGFHEADLFFAFYTQIAEWFIIVFAGIVSYYANKRLGYQFILWASVQGILVWTIKRWINAPRPASISMDQIRRIPGVEPEYWHSFPSGHTAIGVLCFGFIAMAASILLRKNNTWIELCLLYLGLAMGYSRMYLGQHSLLDVSIGGLLALVFLHTSQWFFNNWNAKVAKPL